MPNKLIFTRATSLEGLAESKLHVREVKRAAKLFKRGDLIPESIWVVANSMLAERSRALSFSTRRSYVECMREVLHNEPHLRLGVGPYLPDKQFSGIEFIEEVSNDADPT